MYHAMEKSTRGAWDPQLIFAAATLAPILAFQLKIAPTAVLLYRYPGRHVQPCLSTQSCLCLCLSSRHRLFPWKHRWHPTWLLRGADEPKGCPVMIFNMTPSYITKMLTI